MISHSAARFLQRALQHHIHAKTFAGLFHAAYAFGANLTCGNHLQRVAISELSKLDDQRLGQSVTECLGAWDLRTVEVKGKTAR